MKNIAILSSCLTRGGAERAAGELSVHMAKYANIYLFLLEKKPITYNYKGKIIQLDFEEYYTRLSEKPFGFLLSKYAYIKIIRDIKFLKKKYKIDSSISFLEMLNIMNILSRGKERVYVSVRNNRSMQNTTKRQKIENWFIKHLYKRTENVISLSDGCTEDLEKNFAIPREKIVTIYNYFDFEGIKRKANEEITDDLKKIMRDKIVLLSMGRYVEQKNFEQLIEVMELLGKKYNDAILIILGRGPLKEKLQRSIIEKKLENRVFLIDYLPNPMPLIKRADIFVMNSLFEGLCNSIVESMVCGTITISADFKFGAREMIADMHEYHTPIEKFKVCHRGILVPVGNLREMKDAIEYAIDNKEDLQSCIGNAQSFFNDSFNNSVDEQWKRLLKVEE